mgnify:CR=1 FL=1
MQKEELRKGAYYVYRFVCPETKRRRLYKVKYTGEINDKGEAVCIPKQGKQYKGRMECDIRQMQVIESFGDTGESTRVHTPGALGGVQVTGQ